MDARQELEDEWNARHGDNASRCEAHGLATSSLDGMFSVACPACESEMDEFDTVDPDWKPQTQAEIDADYDEQKAEFDKNNLPF